MSDANKALVYRWFREVWNEGREDAIDELFSAAGIAHGISESDVDLRGPEEFKPFVRTLRSAFPDLHIAVEDAMASGDKVTVRVMLEGTHKGDGLGVAPTGRRVRVTGLVMVRIEDGRIVEGWNNWDQLGLLRQIGAMPNNEGRDRFLARA